MAGSNLLQDGGWGQLVTSEAVEECACRFAFERYSEIAGLKHVMLLDQKLLVVPFLTCGYRIETQRTGTIFMSQIFQNVGHLCSS